MPEAARLDRTFVGLPGGLIKEWQRIGVEGLAETDHSASWTANRAGEGNEERAHR
ncbi:hypothetical protein [Amycolatopsis sp. FDAARGOS 1241]|uniref:hypothetical protein n=1 Tax=Amycolatopsis sp. FDAARGOS 1241 TaxID=2778070 RepID=UPI001EF362D8|nr:hypothetical protein [Amycolatopsis sp. FDAARGOS 1241]